MEDRSTAPIEDLGSNAIAIKSNFSVIYPIEYKSTPQRIVVGIFCALSIIGSLLIIFSYLCFKKRRTKAREILVHISLMDLGVALANIIGLSVYFDKYFFTYGLLTPTHSLQDLNIPENINILCEMQAFFAGYFTIGSVFWTVSLMAYLYFRIIHSHTKHALYFLRFCYVFCYGFPLIIFLWLVLTGRLGYSPYDSAGWCTLITKDPLKKRKVDMFVTLFGNDLWIYLAFILIPILYISIRLYVSNKIKDTKKYANEKQMWTALHNVDYKFLFIPIIFISLRMWTCFNLWITDYAGIDVTDKWYFQALSYLSGIGDSSQGFANAILFVIFSKNVRESFMKCILCKKVTVSIESGEGSRMLNPSEQEPTTSITGEENNHGIQNTEHASYGALK